MRNQSNDSKIDFVITWVDGNDKVWQEEKKKYSYDDQQYNKEDDRKERYRDWDNLRYWFRGVEKFAPWVHKIHFVTWGHLPEWLDTSHPKLNVVEHKEFINHKFLPTFNSHTIEWNLHKIKNLTEQFVYFNDDMFLLDQVTKEDFFKHGLPVDMLALQPDIANPDDETMPYIYLNNAMVLAKYFDKYENVKKQPFAYFHVGYPLMYFVYNILEMAFPRFTGFYTVHGPSPLKKQTFETLWDLEPELLESVCSHRFRSKEDISQYALREYQKLSGQFVPKNIHKLCQYYNISRNNKSLINAIKKQKSKIICINDSNHEINFKQAKQEIKEAFEQILEERSSFEK